ncbi:GNAT family N-acetyltransferase [Streptomyces sp. XM4193]|uniref:GNAT family N-acetyltransferase n=1 Tax=Streptomyces sp. XM4193 TaxID=2929782 RepID=UPI001FFB3921|nr:GNAT family N-acetyltransferase [Streptomyces sp. XM4193]MCK1797219.1 GNAT family N-acetyltransferase [Streptomyces sp. XM4193]
MPLLISPLMDPARLAPGTQPSLGVEGGLVLRPWRAEDAGALLEVFADPVIRRWHNRRLDDTEEARRWIQEWRGAWTAGEGAHWAVADGRSDEVLGRISLGRFVAMSGQAEVTYWTAPRARGGGVATRAVRAAGEWALAEPRFHRLELTHSVHNEASCRVAHRSGYALEGTRRRALLHRDGLHDAHLHARLRPSEPEG